MIQISFSELSADQAYALLDTYKTNCGKDAAPAPAPVVTPTQTPVTPAAPVAAPAPAAAPVPLAAPQSYTLEQLSVAAAPLLDAGKLQELQDLLRTFGVDAMTSLYPTQYGAFATALRGLGAKI